MRGIVWLGLLVVVVGCKSASTAPAETANDQRAELTTVREVGPDPNARPKVERQKDRYPRKPPLYRDNACTPICDAGWNECMEYCRRNDTPCRHACDASYRGCYFGCP